MVVETCGLSVPPWASDQITDLLHCKRPDIYRSIWPPRLPTNEQT
jgi:hypothetical protein